MIHWMGAAFRDSMVRPGSEVELSQLERITASKCVLDETIFKVL